MYLLDVLQNQWLAIALVGGLVLVLCVVLYYVAMWRRRADVGPQTPQAGPGAKRPGAVPEILVLVYVFAVVFVVVYTLIMVRNPPNW